MKPKHCILKQVGDKLFVDVWMEPKPKVNEDNNTDLYIEYLVKNGVWEKSAQTIEVHPTQEEAFKELYYPAPYLMDDYMVTEVLEDGLEIPCENIEIIELAEKGKMAYKYAFLHQEKEVTTLEKLKSFLNEESDLEKQTKENKQEKQSELKGFCEDKLKSSTPSESTKQTQEELWEEVEISVMVNMMLNLRDKKTIIEFISKHLKTKFTLTRI